ncbi:endonuclease/exonuclease/phosphatase family protein [Planctomycetota bacterium]|nr:endonuclease/exonuclease/phosphatase family protein [Planctomycetota bacterium]
MLATWNIRNFDDNRFGHGPRLPESFFYLAEIIRRFDVVALQEVAADLTALRRLLQILGPYWDFVAAEPTPGVSGNRERMAFVFDRRKVRFDRIAYGLVLPPSSLVQEERQFARTPYVAAFSVGSFRFKLCTVHVYYGRNGVERRVAEIDRLVEALGRDARGDSEYNMIVLGDFNIVDPDHRTMTALRRGGRFYVPDEVAQLETSLGGRHYDQIAFFDPGRDLARQRCGVSAGVFDCFDFVFREEDAREYEQVLRDTHRAIAGERREGYYRDTWRTYQMSDHFPLWVELGIDYTDSLLEQLERPAVAGFRELLEAQPLQIRFATPAGSTLLVASVDADASEDELASLAEVVECWQRQFTWTEVTVKYASARGAEELVINGERCGQLGAMLRTWVPLPETALVLNLHGREE